MLIQTSQLSPDKAGEVLREFSFGNNGLGAYYNSNVNSMFERVTNKFVLNDLLEQYARFLPEDWKEFDYSIKYFFFWGDNKNKLEVIFWNDGDTVLIFNDCGRILWNSDAKKDYGWKEDKI